MAKQEKIETLKDQKLPDVIKAAYDIGRFDGRREVLEAVSLEMANTKLGLFAMSQEIKHLDALDRGKATIFIDQQTATVCLAAMRKTKNKSYSHIISALARKLKAAQGKS